MGTRGSAGGGGGGSAGVLVVPGSTTLSPGATGTELARSIRQGVLSQATARFAGEERRGAGQPPPGFTPANRASLDEHATAVMNTVDIMTRARTEAGGTGRITARTEVFTRGGVNRQGIGTGGDSRGVVTTVRLGDSFARVSTNLSPREEANRTAISVGRASQERRAGSRSGTIVATTRRTGGTTLGVNTDRSFGRVARALADNGVAGMDEIRRLFPKKVGK